MMSAKIQTFCLLPLFRRRQLKTVNARNLPLSASLLPSLPRRWLVNGWPPNLEWITGRDFPLRCRHPSMHPAVFQYYASLLSVRNLQCAIWKDDPPFRTSLSLPWMWMTTPCRKIVVLWEIVQPMHQLGTATSPLRAKLFRSSIPLDTKSRGGNRKSFLIVLLPQPAPPRRCSGLQMMANIGTLIGAGERSRFFRGCSAAPYWKEEGRPSASAHWMHLHMQILSGGMPSHRTRRRCRSDLDIQQKFLWDIGIWIEIIPKSKKIKNNMQRDLH